MMKNMIKDNIENSNQLEKLYRADKKEFEKAFFEIYHEIAEFKFWEY